ncbi:MAG: MarR family transcriptional regulator [Sandaracinus sp.]
MTRSDVPSSPPRARASLSVSPGLDLMRLLLHVSHGIERVSMRMESSLGVTAQQRLVVRVVGRHPGITPGRLAAHLHLDPGTISALVRRLERKGLVRRSRDPRDGRRVTLGLTPTGRELDHLQPGTVEAVLERLSSEEDTATVTAVRSFLTKVAEGLEQAAGADPTAPST